MSIHEQNSPNFQHRLFGTKKEKVIPGDPGPEIHSFLHVLQKMRKIDEKNNF